MKLFDAPDSFAPVHVPPREAAPPMRTVVER